MATSMTVEQLISRALEEAVSRIIKKVSEGKRLNDSEITMLAMSLMMRRFDNYI
jgi:hypothetical protein